MKSVAQGPQCSRMPYRRILSALVAFSLLIPVLPARAANHITGSNAAGAVRHSDEAPEPLGPLSTSEKQGYGCLFAGAASLAVTAIPGSGPMIGVFTGAAALPPVGTAGLGLAIAGTIFASTCAVGALVAPTAIRLWRYYYEGAAIKE